MDHLANLKKRLRNAQQRARYWSGNPSNSGFGYDPTNTSSGDADTEYEMALDDCTAIADEIERLTGKRPKTSDPKREYNAKFVENVLTKIRS